MRLVGEVRLWLAVSVLGLGMLSWNGLAEADKYCPVGGEVYHDQVKYCPNHGVELKFSSAPVAPQANADQAISGILGLVGLGLQAHQAHEQQKQINAYNNAVIQQQQAGARILNAIAAQAEQRR